MPDPLPVGLRNWSLITFEVIVAAAAGLLWGLWFTYPVVALAVRDGARSGGAVLVAVVVVTLVQAAFVVGIVGFLRQRVIVTATGLIVKNVIHTNTIAWSELGGLSAQIIIGDAGDRWQGVVALLAGSDRAVALMATTTRRPERCQHYLDQLRSLAPPTALTADTLAHTPAPAVLRPAHAPGRRLVVRSRSLTGSMSVAFVLWLGVALVPVIVSVALLVQHHTAARVIGGLITLALVGAITIGVRRATVARLIVSRAGLKTRGMPSRLGAALDWTEVADLTGTPVRNDQQSRVGGELAAVTTAGSVKPLFPTQRQLRQAYELRGDILAYRP